MFKIILKEKREDKQGYAVSGDYWIPTFVEMAVKESRREIITTLWDLQEVFMSSNCVKFCFKEAHYFKTLRILIFCYSILFGEIKSLETWVPYMTLNCHHCNSISLPASKNLLLLPKKGMIRELGMKDFKKLRRLLQRKGHIKI